MHVFVNCKRAHAAGQKWEMAAGSTTLREKKGSKTSRGAQKKNHARHVLHSSECSDHPSGCRDHPSGCRDHPSGCRGHLSGCRDNPSGFRKTEASTSRREQAEPESERSTVQKNRGECKQKRASRVRVRKEHGPGQRPGSVIRKFEGRANKKEFADIVQ
jgi:hypothetical protein